MIRLSHSLALTESLKKSKFKRHSNKSFEVDPGALLNPEKRFKIGSIKISFYFNRVAINV